MLEVYTIVGRVTRSSHRASKGNELVERCDRHPSFGSSRIEASGNRLMDLIRGDGSIVSWRGLEFDRATFGIHKVPFMGSTPVIGVNLPG